MASNQLLASDNFASGSLAAGWGTMPVFPSGMCQVVNAPPMVTEAKALSTTYGQMWTGISWPNDHICELTLQTFTADTNNSFYMFVRMQNAVDSGYMIVVSWSGTVWSISLIRRDAGVGTTLVGPQTVTAVSSGDVWQFAAMGAGLHVYQNGLRILYFIDATYASGRPGFGQFTPTALTHNQISSWRGYSGVQQDGVWQKRGIIIPALASDIGASNFAGTFIPTAVLYEGNAQVLSGTVYKMWFGSNFAATSNILYAESTDGINWTRYGSPVIATQLGPAIIKNAGTYYMYTQSGMAFGTGNIICYTSPDGITWTLQNSNVIALGTAGAWDSVQIFTFAPIAQIAGTWYAAYGGTKLTAGPTARQGSTGLATSVDLINWTKYGGNPVLTGWPTQAFVNVRGLWYGWFQECQLGQNSTAPGTDPTESVRYSSPDLITWSNPVHSVHHSQLHEAVNWNTGQCFINSMINIGGKTYAYLNSEPNDAVGPQVYQIGLAIAPTTIENLVNFREDGTQQISSDNFTQGTGSLPVKNPNWVTPTGVTALSIVAGNKVEPSATNVGCGALYTGGNPISAAQYSETTIAANLINCSINLIVRGQTGSDSGYQANILGPSDGTTARPVGAIIKRVSGAGTTLFQGPLPAGNLAQMITSVGDVIRFTVANGSDGLPVLSIFQNGFLLCQWQDYSNTYATGYPGILLAENVGGGAQISSWAGGNSSVLPPYPPGSGGDLGPGYDFKFRM